MITPRYIASLREVRLYKDSGHYWPISVKHLDKDEIDTLIRFFVEDEVKEFDVKV